MPEGDTIHRTAVNLRRVLEGKRIVSSTGHRQLQGGCSVADSVVTEVEARGKHLLIHFDDGRVLHSHMGMTGSWHIYRTGDAWRKPKKWAAATLTTDGWCVVCFTPKLIELVSLRRLRQDCWLQRLGPDILGGPIPDELLLARFRTQDRLTIGEAVMNQTVVSGIGNIYKSESLFAVGIHPLSSVQSLPDDSILRVCHVATSLMKQNLNTGSRRTRQKGDGQRLWVYGRCDQDCLKCGHVIQRIRQGDLGRSTYYCPTCQGLL